MFRLFFRTGKSRKRVGIPLFPLSPYGERKRKMFHWRKATKNPKGVDTHSAFAVDDKVDLFVHVKMGWLEIAGIGDARSSRA
jgi:hypothetical protein